MSNGRPSNIDALQAGPPDNHLAITRFDTISSIASDATASNLPGPGRTVGLLFDWLGNRFEVFLNKMATRRGLGPTATAREIRRLRRHYDTSFQSRLATALCSLPQSEVRSLKKLCDKLLKYTRSPVLSTQLKALEELLELTIEDPIIRRLVSETRLDYIEPEYREPDLIASTSRTLGSIRDTYTHHLWSDFILNQRLPVAGEAFVIPEGLSKALKDSLSRPTSSFVAARYLLRALEVYQDRPKGFNKRPRTSVLQGIGRHYIEFAVSNSAVIEWSNLDGCVTFLPHLFNAEKSSKSACNLLYQLAGSLIREAQNVPHTLFDYFLVSPECRRGLKDTIFLDEHMIAHSHLESAVWYTSLADERFINGPSDRTSSALFDELALLGMYLRAEQLRDENSPFTSPTLMTILIARSLAYSRYHKLAFHSAMRMLSTETQNKVPFTPKTLNTVYERATSRRRLHHSRAPDFSMVLGRILVDGEYYVHDLQQQLSEAPSHIKRRQKYGLMDNMVLNANDVICLDVDGLEKPFDSTGHYPVLVGRCSSGEESYLAVIETVGADVEYAYGCVKDGGSTATYKDNRGTHVVHKFKVLALRYDPCDLHPPYPPTDPGAVDPTGPLFWRIYTVDFVILYECGLSKELWSALVTGNYKYIKAPSPSDEKEGDSDGSSDATMASAESPSASPSTTIFEDKAVLEGEDATSESEKVAETEFNIMLGTPIPDPETSNEGEGDRRTIHQLSEKLDSAEEQIAELKRKIEALEAHT